MPPRQVFLIGWTGLRGVVSLAAALALPIAVQSGQPFPYRAEIVVIAFVVILVTLVLQGLTLPPLVRRLRLPKEILHEREEARARAHAATAALERLDRATEGPGLSVEVVGRLREVYTERLRRLRTADGNERARGEEEAALRQLRAELLLAERRALVELRDREVISDEVLSRLEHELNLEADASRPRRVPGRSGYDTSATLKGPETRFARTATWCSVSSSVSAHTGPLPSRCWAARSICSSQSSLSVRSLSLPRSP